jgi:hypothetical protein
MGERAYEKNNDEDKRNRSGSAEKLGNRLFGIASKP